MAEIAKIVQGNNFSIAIPLKVYILNEGEVVLEDYTPAEGDDVTIRLVGERRGYTYKPTTEGNVAHLQLSGHEVCDTYAVEVVIIGTDGTMLRSYRGDQLAIVYNVDTIIADGAVEEGELYLDSQFFIQGEKGEQGDPGQDGQDGQDGADGRGIVSITKTATQGLVDTYTITYTDGTTSTFEVTNGKDGSGGGGEDFIVNVTYSGGTYTADKTPQECCLAFLDGQRVVFANTASTPLYGDSRTFIATSVSVYNQYNQWNIYAVSGNGRFDAKVDILCYEKQYTASLTFKSITATTIIDNLTSSSTTAALSANQGRELKGLVDGKANTADLAAVATSGNYNDLNNKPSIPTKTSDLTNDSGFVVDADYVHTDSNYTVAEKSKLSGISAGAEANVQSDWSVTETNSDAFIKNKPTIPTESTVSGWGFTKNTGTITGIKMNGTSKGTSGVVDLGTVLTSFTETDPTVPNWAKQPNKPAYTANEVGALPNTTEIPSKTSDLINDSGFLTSYTETDPTVPSWAKASTKPTYNGSEVNYTGTTGNVVTNNTTLNVAIKAIDDAIGNVETLLASI